MTTLCLFFVYFFVVLSFHFQWWTQNTKKFDKSKSLNVKINKTIAKNDSKSMWTQNTNSPANLNYALVKGNAMKLNRVNFNSQWGKWKIQSHSKRRKKMRKSAFLSVSLISIQLSMKPNIDDPMSSKWRSRKKIISQMIQFKIKSIIQKGKNSPTRKSGTTKINWSSRAKFLLLLYLQRQTGGLPTDKKRKLFERTKKKSERNVIKQF